LLAHDLVDHHDLSDCAFAGFSSPKNEVLFVPPFEIEVAIDHSGEARSPTHPSHCCLLEAMKVLTAISGEFTAPASVTVA
jgi:hypothetical protein